MPTMQKVFGWMQIALAGLAAVMQGLSVLHGQTVDSGHTAVTAGVLLSGVNHVTKAK